MQKDLCVQMRLLFKDFRDVPQEDMSVSNSAYLTLLAQSSLKEWMISYHIHVTTPYAQV